MLTIVIILCIITAILYRKNNELYRYNYISNSTQRKLQTINILMVGNSFIYKNSLWKTIQKLLDSTGLNYTIERAAAPSLSLKQHRDNGKLEPILRAKRYDYIILQEKSMIPLKYPDRLSGNVQKMIEYINQYQPPGWIPILYETYSKCYRSDLDPLGGQIIISKAYEKAARDNNCALAKVGDAFMKFRLLDSFDITDPILLKCTEKDTIHPSEMGSVLSAMVFYRLIVGKSIGPDQVIAVLDLPNGVDEIIGIFAGIVDSV